MLTVQCREMTGFTSGAPFSLAVPSLQALAHHAAAIKAIMNEEWGDVVLNPAEVGAETPLSLHPTTVTAVLRHHSPAQELHVKHQHTQLWLVHRLRLHCVTAAMVQVGAEVSLTPGKNGEQRFTLTLTGKVRLCCSLACHHTGRHSSALRRLTTVCAWGHHTCCSLCWVLMCSYQAQQADLSNLDIFKHRRLQWALSHDA